MTISDLKNYTRTMEISLAEEFGEAVSITIKEPDTTQFLSLQKAGIEGGDAAIRWASNNLSNLIVNHTFDDVTDVKELASALTKHFGVLLKVTKALGVFLDRFDQKQKETKK